jgi:hypothetical protein
MTPQQMRLIRPLTRQRRAAQAVLTTGALAIGPLLFVCTWVREYSETFAEVMRPTGRRI